VNRATREQVRAGPALKLAPNHDVRAMAVLALARAGDTAGAEKLAAELDKTFPRDTLVQRYWLPMIRAGVALERKDPNRAVELLKMASTIELGFPTSLWIVMCPAHCVETPISCSTTATQPRWNFRSSLTTEDWWGTFPGARWPGWGWQSIRHARRHR